MALRHAFGWEQPDQGSLHRFFKLFILLIAIALLGACAKTKSFSNTSALRATEGPPKIVLMPLDVELSVLTAGGMEELNAEWTELGEANLLRAIKARRHMLDVRFVDYETLEESFVPEELAVNLELERLHRAVGNAIYYHNYVGLPLPTKENVFDWSLGPDSVALGEGSDADYALFVHARQSFTSGGRKALQAFGAILFGAYIPGGTQQGFFSLVDLRTGDVVWFNALVLDKTDLRDQDGADKFASWMFENFPERY